ncbi:MAG: cytochrome c1 [Alphaproteobacteria bacterium]|nr:cytochrome c1 [Alphaproteobacteria bacterium]
MVRATRLFAAVAAVVAAFAGASAFAASEHVAPPKQDWPFSDVLFGKFDEAATQRGLQVYLEVCSSCHGLRLVAYRNLVDLGYTEEQVKAIAARFQVQDGPNDAGDMFDRPGRPSDRFVSPFANEQAARASNGGALPPDLSLTAKAKLGGPDYIYAVLTGYAPPPAGFELGEGMNYNAYFPGHQIAMPAPLTADGVTYADGTKATVEQMAWDVSNFLIWTAEPKLEERRKVGLKVVLFLLGLAVVLYAAKLRMWAGVAH